MGCQDHKLEPLGMTACSTYLTINFCPSLTQRGRCTEDIRMGRVPHPLQSRNPALACLRTEARHILDLVLFLLAPMAGVNESFYNGSVLERWVDSVQALQRSTTAAAPCSSLRIPTASIKLESSH